MKKVFVKILASLLLFVVIKFLYLTNEVSRSKMVSFCWQNDALRIDLFESAKYLKDVVVLSPSNSDTLVIVSYVTSSLSIFYGKLSRSATLKVDKNAKYLKLDNDSITYDLYKDIKRCSRLYK